MLLNFCDSRLRTEIKCSTISTEGYEVTNLIREFGGGFLAYSCIRPPVHIDITFICNIHISHIVIWPTVGSQKSSGFQLHSRDTNLDHVPYTLVSTGFLSPSDTGLLFHSAIVNFNEISVPEKFVKCCIKRSSITHIQSVRLTICKTEKSVPALGRIEIWGIVSPRCGKDVVASVHSLWFKSRVALPSPERELDVDTDSTKEIKQEAAASSGLEIPESFLDAITWELMTQPVTLPSGNVIDQTTLEKHGQNEAIWGRSFTDPFTGMLFTEHRRPVMATALKFRIDKFLLENSDSKEIKSIPRVLGHSSALTGDRRVIEIPKCVLNEISPPPLVRRTAEDAKLDANQEQAATNDISNYLQRSKRHCHRLPAIITGPKHFTININARSRQVKQISSFFQPLQDKSSSNKNNESNLIETNIDNSLDNSETFLLPDIKRFNAPEKIELRNASNCKCCASNVLYKLPCKHMICRKILLSIKDNRCNSCGFSYQSSEIERVHGNISTR